MINFKLLPENFNHLEKQYRIVPINFINFKYFYSLIDDSINYFNQELDWKDMFTLDVAYQRIKDGMTMYVGMIDAGVFGYVWFDNKNDGRSLFNLFVRNKVNIKNYSGQEFVSDVIYRFEYDKVIYSEVDEWNEKSIKLFKKLGFQEL